MLLDRTNNKYVLNIFYILVEVLIGFSTFTIFFGIFMIYFMTKYEVNLIGDFIKQNISFYKQEIPEIPQTIKHNITQYIDNSEELKNLQQDVYTNEHEVNEYNKPFDNKLIYIIICMIGGLLLLILIPIILGVIRLNQIDFKYIGLSIIFHIILIIGLELVFLLFIITYINPVKLYKLFDINYKNTGNYFGIHTNS